MKVEEVRGDGSADGGCEATIENGFAVVEAGSWLTGATGAAAEHDGKLWFAACDRPFLTRLDLGERVSVVASKLLVAPLSSRRKRRLLRLEPFSFRDAVRVFELEIGWAVMATSSRTMRLVAKEGDTLTVSPSSLVAWTGRRPTGFCPRLRLRDLLLPRKPRVLWHFHGPCIVWIEGC